MDIGHIIIESPVLDMLCCSNEAMLAVAADRSYSVFDTDESESPKEGGSHYEGERNPLRDAFKISALLADGVY